MDKPDYLISTPENVDLHLELAGMANRVIAAVIDALCIVVLWTVLAIVAIIVIVAAEASGVGTTAKTSIHFWVICLYTLATTLLMFGYFVVSEGKWKGQTLGKKVVGIRVIDANGQPAGWGAVCIRNFIRLLDLFFYVGILAILFDKNERRFGDMCAGTIVIRERFQPLGTTGLRIAANAPIDASFDTGQVSPDEYNLLVSFLKRREMMSPEDRTKLATSIDSHFRNALGMQDASESPERLIEKIFIAYRQRAELEAI